MPARSPIWWNAFPALLCAGAVAAGIAGNEVFPFWMWMAAAGGLLGTAGVALLWPSARLVSLRPLVYTLLLLGALAALGAARVQQDQALPPAHVGHLASNALAEGERPIVLAGRVRDVPVRSRRSTRFVLTAQKAFVPSDTGRGRPVRVTGAVVVTLRPSSWDTSGALFPPVAEGDLLRLNGALRAPPRPRNPAAFDYGAYLRRQGLHATMALYEPGRVAVVGRQRTMLERAVVPARHFVERQIARHVPGREPRALLRALLLGDRGLLAETTEERFARSGLMHLLAVSGLHVLLVGWIFFQVLRPSLLRLRLSWTLAEWSRAALTLGVLGFYVLLAGAPVSATRAVFMAALLMGATLAQRPAHALNTLGAAAVLLLAWRPAQLFEAGFQLSFAAVGALVTLVPAMQKRLPRGWEDSPWRKAATQSTLTTLAATLGTLPVLLAHFGRAPFAGLVLNLWAIPLMAVVLLGGLAVIAFGGWSASLAASAGAATSLSAEGLFWTARMGNATADWTLLQAAGEPGPWVLAALTAALLVFVAWPRPRWRWRLAALSVGLVAAGLWHGVLHDEYAPRLDALFFDVGHGDAALLSLPSGEHVLLDTGGRSPAGSAAQYAVLPYLEAHGIKRLHAILLSHPDGDHLGGLPALLRNVEVGRLVTGGGTAATALYEETQHVLDSLRVPVRTARAGDTLHLGSQVAARVLSPTRRLVETASANDASLAVQIAYGEVRLLFTGDAEARTERLLATSYGPLLQSDVVKVGHHGSGTSSVPSFVRVAARNAAFAVASSGRRFGLPNEQVLDRWRAAGATPLTTARDGALWLRTDGERVWRVRWRR